jgi:hypothetical protein
MNTKTRKPMHSCLVILLYGAGGIILALVIAWVIIATTIPSTKAPTQIPPPPSAAKTILGIDASGFLQSDPYIQTTDGNTYFYNGSEWTVATPPEDFRDEACQPDNIKIIEAVSGKVSACRQVEVTLETFCPPTNTYAISQDGKVWKLTTEDQACNNMVLRIPLLFIFGLGGMGFGVLMVIVRWSFTASMKS